MKEQYLDQFCNNGIGGRHRNASLAQTLPGDLLCELSRATTGVENALSHKSAQNSYSTS